jgi:cellulose synthase/poly-beta-1,6-N-acetylglucosamine synthase-like glycosyltransferase
LLKEYFKSIDQAGASTQYKAYHFSACQAISKAIFPDFLYKCIYGKPPKNSFESLLYDENVYLAEDRTLCMGIYQNGYNLTYLPDATAWVDPMKTLYGLLGQRKRWINGSYFAF